MTTNRDATSFTLLGCLLLLAMAAAAGDDAAKAPGPPSVTVDAAGYKVTASIKAVKYGAAKQGRAMVLFDVIVGSASVPPFRFGFGHPNEVKSVTTDAGEVLPGEYDLANGIGSHTGGYKVTISAAVPEGTRWLRDVTAVLQTVRPAKTETISWDGPAASRGQERKAGDFVFTMVSYQETAETADVVLQCKVPPELSSLTTFFDGLLRCQNGKDVRFGSGGSNVTRGRCQWNRTYKLRGALPTAFEFSVPTEAIRETLTIHMQNLALPESPLAPAERQTAGTGGGAAEALNEKVRGPAPCTSGDFTFQLKSLECRTGADTCLAVDLTVTAKPDPKRLFLSLSFADIAAQPDIGKPLASRPPFGAPWFFDAPNTTVAAKGQLALPDKGATRLVTLTGSYPVVIADDARVIEIPLPAPGAALNSPIVKSPVRLESLNYADGAALLRWSIDSAALAKFVPERRPGEPPSPSSLPAKAELLDAAGKALKHVRTDKATGASPDTRLAFNGSYELGGTKPAMARIRYAAKAHVQSYPFKFDNVPLPTKTPKTEFEKLEF